MKVLALFKTLRARLGEGLRRFPIALIMAALTVAVLIYMNHLDYSHRGVIYENLVRMAMVFALGIPLFLCIQVLIERMVMKGRNRMLVYLLGAAALGLYYLFLLGNFEMVEVTRYIAISLSLYLAFFIIPYYKRKEGIELYVLKLLVSFFIAYLYSMILFLGLAAIILTINGLFSANIPGKVIFDIWLLVAGIFAPAYFLSEIPPADETPSLEQYSRVIQVLLTYIVMPLLSVYATILYIYFGKILIKGQWPIQMISHLVLWFAIISAAVIFAIYPLREKNPWVKGFTTWFPKLMLPLLGMMFAAMGIRIGDYGITENRYFVMAGGIWITASMLYLIYKRDAKPIFLPKLLTIILIVSVVGPISAYSASKYSQNQRLYHILEDYNMVENQKVVKAKEEIPLEDQKEISSILSYFEGSHGLKEVKALPSDFRIIDMKEVLGFPYISPYDYANAHSYHSYMLDEEQEIIDVHGYDYFINHRFPWKSQSNSPHQGPLSYEYSNNYLKILYDGSIIFEKDLAIITEEIHRNNEGNGQLTQDKMRYSEKNDQAEIVILFKDIGISEDHEAEELTLKSAEFYLLVKLK